MNIFLYSTRRQPIRTALLLLISALTVFAFTARAAEYLLVTQETRRLGAHYRAIGQLTQLDAGAESCPAAVDGAVSLLENDPRVALVDQPRYISAVMQGIYNADINGYGSAAVNVKNLDVFFTGTFTGAAGTEAGDVLCGFIPDELLSCYPEFIEPGRSVNMVVARGEAADTVKSLEIGERYLVRGHFDSSEDIMFSVTHTPTKFRALPLAENAPFFYRIPAGQEPDWSSHALSGAAAEMQQCRDEQSALMAITTGDMSAMPDAQPDSLIYLTDGRWLDSADQADGSKVCVINAALAQLRGLSIGDSIELTFRGAEHYNGYINYPETGSIPEYETISDSFEIVGLYDYTIADMREATVYRNLAYFPDSAVPAGFDPFKDMRTAADLSFVLTSPALEAEFLAGTQERLYALGLQAEFLESGWSDFQAAVQPMLHASFYNLIVFALILLTVLNLVAFFYFRARRRDIAIARALGVPAGVCVRQGALPLALIGLTGTLFGAVSGGSAPTVLTPAGVMDVVMKGSPYYITARFSVDPAKNRELGAFRQALDEIVSADSAGLVPLRALLWDDDLRNVVEPLENSIRLMEVLYPVALALSLLTAAGVSALLILTEAREAAIMRVLGTTKLRSRVMLVLQIVLVVLAGLLFGLAAALALSHVAGTAWAVFGMSALCAAAYLVCAVAGSAATAVTVTNRLPLELLQVKE